MFQVSNFQIRTRGVLVGEVDKQPKKYICLVGTRIADLNKWIFQNMGIPINGQRLTFEYPARCSQALPSDPQAYLITLLDGVSKIQIKRV